MEQPSGSTQFPGALGQLSAQQPGVRQNPISLSGGGLGTTSGHQPKWVKVLDKDRCIGCHACTTACKSENDVPLDVTRTFVKYVDVGNWPQAERAFQVTRCNQCEDAPCVAACPTSAMFKRSDGIVDFDKSICIGCKACMAACPYDAIFINPNDHSAEKCNFCAHRLEMGLEPACVVVCPTEAILVGDLNDPTSKVASIVNRNPVSVRRPEKETGPKVFYKGATQATLDPLAARRPSGDTYMWSEKRSGRGMVNSGHPRRYSSSAAAVVSYDINHTAPWDWRVSLYTWTKGIAAGAYLVPVLLILVGAIETSSSLWRWVAPLTSLVGLAATGGLLIWDLEHPERFYMIFTRPQWRSWLVRGGVIISAYGAVLSVHLLFSLLEVGPPRALAVLGAPLAVLTAVYTAYLFAQSTGRDLWQSPLLPTHLMVQTLLLGAGVALLFDYLGDREAAGELQLMVALAGVVHLLMIWGEARLAHSTAHAHLAEWEMVRGSYAWFFWAGVALVVLGVGTAMVGPLGGLLAVAGLLAHEHAYVQAGQAVPLA